MIEFEDRLVNHVLPGGYTEWFTGSFFLQIYQITRLIIAIKQNNASQLNARSWVLATSMLPSVPMVILAA